MPEWKYVWISEQCAQHTAEVKLRTKRFKFGGGSYPLVHSSWLRWWIADVKPDGSKFLRHTSFGGRFNPGKDLFDGVPQHSYTPTALIDQNGKLIPAVVSKFESVWNGKLLTGTM